MALNVVHWLGAFLLFAAMGLLIVASVSAPIWDNVGYLKGTVNGVRTTMGNWGMCTSNGCSSSGLGYDKSFFSTATGASNAGSTIVSGLSKTLILAPICAGLTFIALLFALSTHLVMGLLASLMSLLALVATVVYLGLALGFFLTARQRINHNIPNSSMHVSSVVWLVVAAAGCQLVAAITVCFTRNRRSRKARDAEFSTVPAMRSTQAEPMVTDYYSASAAPTSTVGSTGPLVHDNNTMMRDTNTATYRNNNDNAGVYDNNNNRAGVYDNITSTYDNDAVGQPTGPTTTSGVNNHWWKRS
ncbi:hypothetical protein JCM3770_002779 [Rhodotorula araucariae]